MNHAGPNLAAQPFANERPVKRATLLIWVVALTLLAVNIFLYQRHLSAHYEQRQTIRDLQERIEAEEEKLRKAEGSLADLQLEQQNDRVIFLNGQIARRTFRWSQLFDRLEEVLPANVELGRVSPKILHERRRGGRRSKETVKDLVAIDMRGESRSGEELLQLVDNLFEHPSFTLPNLQGENERDDGRIEFTLTALYLPSAGPREAAEDSIGSIEEAVLVNEAPGGDG